MYDRMYVLIRFLQYPCHKTYVARASVRRKNEIAIFRHSTVDPLIRSVAVIVAAAIGDYGDYGRLPRRTPISFVVSSDLEMI
jgi:hypothetical protein